MDEVITKRTENTKTFDLGNGKMALQVFNSPIHHLEDGQFVDTDFTLHDLLTEIKSGSYPYPVSFDKRLRSLTIVLNGHPITISPINPKLPTVVMQGQNVWLKGLWDGVDVLLSLGAYGLDIHYKVASLTGKRVVAWNITDPDGVFSNTTLTYGTEPQVAVPNTYEAGVYSIDLSSVPVGSEVE